MPRKRAKSSNLKGYGKQMGKPGKPPYKNRAAVKSDRITTPFTKGEVEVIKAIASARGVKPAVFVRSATMQIVKALLKLPEQPLQPLGGAPVPAPDKAQTPHPGDDGSSGGA